MRNTTLSVYLILFITLLLQGCGYKGDGEYYEEGTWPFKNYSLTLPKFEVKNGTKIEYNLSNYNGNRRTFLILRLSSKYDILFLETKLQMSFTVLDNKDNVIKEMHKNIFNNIERMRMRKAGKTLVWKNDEWKCDFRYVNKNIDRRVVPFDDKKPPIKQSELSCWNSIATPPKGSKIKVIVWQKNTAHELSAFITLESRWK